MFSGIIENTHIVNKIDSSQNPTKLYINYNKNNLSLGDSVSINGVCLTVSEIQGNILVFDLSNETIIKTNLSMLRVDSHVNLELPLTLNQFISGYLVSGHIDTTVKINAIPKLSKIVGYNPKNGKIYN